jgi:hypothetical protein
MIDAKLLNAIKDVESKIGTGSGSGGISSGNIEDGSIYGNHIAANTISNYHILDGTISGKKLNYRDTETRAAMLNFACPVGYSMLRSYKADFDDIENFTNVKEALEFLYGSEIQWVCELVTISSKQYVLCTRVSDKSGDSDSGSKP